MQYDLLKHRGMQITSSTAALEIYYNHSALLKDLAEAHNEAQIANANKGKKYIRGR